MGCDVDSIFPVEVAGGRRLGPHGLSPKAFVGGGGGCVQWTAYAVKSARNRHDRTTMANDGHDN
jgi:hypothetical protein